MKELIFSSMIGLNRFAVGRSRSRWFGEAMGLGIQVAAGLRR